MYVLDVKNSLNKILFVTGVILVSACSPQHKSKNDAQDSAPQSDVVRKSDVTQRPAFICEGSKVGDEEQCVLEESIHQLFSSKQKENSEAFKKVFANHSSRYTSVAVENVQEEAKNLDVKTYSSWIKSVAETLPLGFGDLFNLKLSQNQFVTFQFVQSGQTEKPTSQFKKEDSDVSVLEKVVRKTLVSDVSLKEEKDAAKLLKQVEARATEIEKSLYECLSLQVAEMDKAFNHELALPENTSSPIREYRISFHINRHEQTNQPVNVNFWSQNPVIVDPLTVRSSNANAEPRSEKVLEMVSALNISNGKVECTVVKADQIVGQILNEADLKLIFARKK